ADLHVDAAEVSLGPRGERTRPRGDRLPAPLRPDARRPRRRHSRRLAGAPRRPFRGPGGVFRRFPAGAGRAARAAAAERRYPPAARTADALAGAVGAGPHPAVEPARPRPRRARALPEGTRRGMARGRATRSGACGRARATVAGNGGTLERRTRTEPPP